MSTRSSKKREGGDKSNEIPPKKMVQEVMEDPVPANYDVTIIVDGQRFQCLKEELSQHSKYLEAMFNSDLQEKNKKEVELGGIESGTFDMFLKVIHGEEIVTDVTVEKMLSLADYLISASLEQTCMRHLANETAFPLKEQFLFAETHNSEKLMRQVCGSIKDAHELDEVLPKDVDFLCNSTKNIIMQKSFHLLGIRQSPSPPLPEDPDQLFEHRMNQIIDQIEIQNHNGEVLYNQIFLLVEDKIVDLNLFFNGTARQVIRDNHLIKELTDELRKVHEPEEVNFIQAQILVIKKKDMYTMMKNPENAMDPATRTTITTAIRKKLKYLALLINRNKRSHRSFRVTLGNREIDRIYRSYTEKVIRYCQREHPRHQHDHAPWIDKLNEINNFLSEWANDGVRIQRAIPDGLRHVSNEANFQMIDEIVSNMRLFHYSDIPEPEDDENDDEDGSDQDVDPEEQEQEQN